MAADRRTAFALLGAMGGLFILLAMVFLVIAIQSLRQQQGYQMGHCTITSKQLLTDSFDASNPGPGMYAPHFDFTVDTADGGHSAASGYDGVDTFTSDQNGQQSIVDSYTIGQTYPCWYNPSHPTEAVLVRHLNWLLFALSALFLFLGGGSGTTGLLIRLGRLAIMSS